MEPPTPTDSNSPSFRRRANRPSPIITTLPPTHPLTPAFAQKLREMALPLAPFVQLTTGDIHPLFPPTLLHFWLLTEDQLDDLASFYHQRTPCQWTAHYPCPVSWARGLTLEEKRRKIGKFIGLRGCATPVWVEGMEGEERPWGRAKTEEEIMEDARRARGGGGAGDEEGELRRKMGWF